MLVGSAGPAVTDTYLPVVLLKVYGIFPDNGVFNDAPHGPA